MATAHPLGAPILHLWKAQIENYEFLAKLSCFTDNFTSFEFLLATSIESAVDYTGTLNDNAGGRTDVAPTIKEYNTECVRKGQLAYETFADTVSRLKNTTVNKKDWTQAIDDAATKAKVAAMDAIDDAAQRAKDYIGKLPERARDPAAHLFIAGTKVVLNFFATVWDRIKEVLASIAQFFENVWEILGASVRAVGAAAELAVVYITGAGGDQSVRLVGNDYVGPQHGTT